MSNPWQNIQQSQQNLQNFSRAGQQASDNARFQGSAAARRANAAGRAPRSAIGRFFGFVFGLVAVLVMFGVFALIAAEVLKRSR